MKLKLSLAAILLVLFGALLLSQVNLVKAQTVSGGGPITGPISGPVLHYINGKILYRYFGWYKPAGNVTVEVVNTQTKVGVTTKTQANGYYELLVGDGNYKVRPFDSRKTIFTPLVRYITVNGGSVSGLDFLGLPLTW